MPPTDDRFLERDFWERVFIEIALQRKPPFIDLEGAARDADEALAEWLKRWSGIPEEVPQDLIERNAELLKRGGY